MLKLSTGRYDAGGNDRRVKIEMGREGKGKGRERREESAYLLWPEITTYTDSPACITYISLLQAPAEFEQILVWPEILCSS